MPQPAKRKVSVTLDEELVSEIEAEGENLSGRVNEALRSDLAQRRRHRALGTLLKELDERHGPLDTADDEAEIRRLTRLLGGAADEAEE